MSARPQAFERIPASQPIERLHRLGALLARWHVWRKGFKTERGYARQGGPADPEDELELLLMTTIEQVVGALTMDEQRCTQQIASAECLGVATLPSSQEVRAAIVLARLEARLIRAGIL